MTSQQINQLKNQFERLKQEITTRLNEFSQCIDSAGRFYQENPSIETKVTTTGAPGKVILDVGGEKFTTSVETLTQEKETFFTALFSRQWKSECDPKDGSIFIDRDGKLFTHILAYLRTGSIPNEVMGTESLRQQMIVEAKYYQLNQLVEILTEPERKKLKE